MNKKGKIAKVDSVSPSVFNSGHRYVNGAFDGSRMPNLISIVICRDYSAEVHWLGQGI